MASLHSFSDSPPTIADKGLARGEDMKYLFESAWFNHTLASFYRGFYDAEGPNTISKAKDALKDVVDDKFVATFAELDAMATETPMCEPFATLVNRILSLRPSCIGDLRCYDTHAQEFTSTKSILLPDIVIMPEASIVKDIPSTIPLTESTNAATTSSCSIPPDNVTTRTRSGSRRTSSESTPLSLPSPSPQRLPASNVAVPNEELRWGKVVVVMDLKTPITPGKQRQGASQTDRSRSRFEVEGVDQVLSVPSTSGTQSSHRSQQTQVPARPPRSSASKRSRAGNGDVSAPKKQKAAGSSSTAAGPSQPSGEATFAVPVTPDKAKVSVPQEPLVDSYVPTVIPALLTKPRPPIRPLPGTGPRKPSSSNIQKNSATPTGEDIQLGRYLTEVMSSVGNRTHAFGCILRGNLFQITYVDSVGLSLSARCALSSRESVMEFALFIYGLTRASASDLGFDNRFSMPNTFRGERAGVLPLESTGLRYKVKDMQVTITNPIDLEYSLCGRRTRVFEVLMPHGNSTGPAVLKIGYPYESRPREFSLMAKAKAVLEQNMGHSRGVPFVYQEDQGPLVSEEFRRHFFLPGVPPPVLHQDQRLQIILMERLYPLRILPSPLHIKGMRHIVNTICALGDSKMFHRDVSSSNVMVRFVAGEGGRQSFEGVLTDFDLAVDQTTGFRADAQRQHWTGTLPFLSLSVLQYPGERHLTRFDLESAFYVTIWDMCIYPDGTYGVSEDAAENKAATELLKPWGREASSKADKLSLGLNLNEVGALTKLNDYIEDVAPTLQTKFAIPVTQTAQNLGFRPTRDKWEDLGGLFTPEIARDIFAELDERLSKHVDLSLGLDACDWPPYPIPESDSTFSLTL